MIAITKRNLLVFFRDRASVFFSLLSVFIILGLYILFLGDIMAGSLKDFSGGRFLMDSWIMAGLLSVMSVTVALGALGTMVDDRSNDVLRDMLAAPVKRWQLVGGYILSSFAVGVILSLVTLVLAEVYILVYGGSLLPPMALFKVLGLILLSVFSGSAMMFFMVSFFSSPNAFGVASTVIGTIIGFLTGIYIPIGNLPVAVQWVIKFFPPSHAAVLFRQVMMEEPMEAVFAGAPAEVVARFKQEMGVALAFGDTTMTPLTHILVLLGTAVVFYGLALYLASRKKR